MNRRQRLRELLKADAPLVAPAIFDALGARMVERAGFEVAYFTGNGASASLLGMPDLGLMTLREVADLCRNIALATSLPLIADADTGYGNAINVIRTVREMEAAGVAAIQLEDQVTPKQCGSLPGKKEVVALEEQLGKIRAALDARRDPDFLLIARTDAAISYGLDEAIRRANAYAEAGAHVIFPEMKGTEEELRRVAREVKAPLALNVDEATEACRHTAEELFRMGYRLLIYPGLVRYTYVGAVMEGLKALRAEGTTKSVRGRMASFNEYNDLLGIGQFRSWEERYLRGAGGR